MNIELTRGEINWLQALAEVVLITFGVLGALAVDSWWADRDAAERERVQLEALRVEMRDNLNRFELLIKDQIDVLGSQRQLLRVIHGVDPTPSAAVVGRLVYQSRRFFRLEPVMGAYEALVASGDLRLVGSAELRAELARFYGNTAHGHEDEELSTLYRIEFTRSIVEATDFLAVVPPEARDLYGPPESQFSIDVESVLNSRSLSSYLVLLLRTEYYITEYYQRIRGDAADIIRLINIEIGDLDRTTKTSN
jgi:hypothetical protein